MIEKLFSSQVMFSILSEFFRNQDKKLSVSDLTKLSGKKQPNIKKEVDKLLSFNLIVKSSSRGVNYYSVNKEFLYFSAFNSFFLNYLEESKKYILINEEGGASFLSMQYIMDGFFSNYAVKDNVISFVPELFAHFKNNYFKAYMEEAEVDKLTSESLVKLKNDPSFVFDRIYPISLDYGEKTFYIFRDLKSRNFKISKNRFVEIIDDFREIINVLSSYNMIAVLELKDHTYSNHLKDYLKKKTTGRGMSHFYAFEKLLAPEELSYTQAFKIEVLKFVLEKKNDDYIKKIHDDWAWLNFAYRGPGLSRSYIKESIGELRLKDKTELLKELEDLKVYRENVKKEKEKIFNKLNIDLKYQKFIKALSVLSFLKVYRKDVSFLINYCTFKLIDKFNRKNEKINFHYMTLEELKDFVKNDKLIDREVLNRREQESVYHRDFQDVFVGQDAVDFLKKFKIEDDNKKNNDQKISLLDGMTACLGETGNWVYGDVKIINSPSDMNKMKEGDILISVATTPDILLAMKKASAIVTDHGGITCHAAIVSRELNKPCLIGTRYATKIFKDGDKVIVCPRHGYIKFQ